MVLALFRWPFYRSRGLTRMPRTHQSEWSRPLAKIPKALHPHINNAMADNAVCLLATVLADGHPQVSPRGSTMVFDDTHLAVWERSLGTITAQLKDGDKV